MTDYPGDDIILTTGLDRDLMAGPDYELRTVRNQDDIPFERDADEVDPDALLDGIIVMGVDEFIDLLDDNPDRPPVIRRPDSVPATAWNVLKRDVGDDAAESVVMDLAEEGYVIVLSEDVATDYELARRYGWDDNDNSDRWAGTD